jgi:hypothetical protein
MFCIASTAQKFAEKANLEPVKATGFYSIDITPELSSYITSSFSDLRIADDKDQSLPYIIRTKQPSFFTDNYTKLPITGNELTDSGRSVLIVENLTQQKISAIALLIRNAAVTRMAAISGSDDMSRWFTIAENISLEKQFVGEDDRYIQTVYFPTSSYKFFKITIENGKNNPLNIMEAGRYADVEYKKVYSYYTNPSPVFLQTDSSDHNTYIKVHQPAAYHVGKASLKINGPRFFKRDLDIINGAGISNFKISSDILPDFYLPSFNDTNWTIKIYNGDNLPLKIAGVTTYQESKMMIAYLEAGKSYHLLMNNSLATKPVYDLQQFKDSIPYNIPGLKIISYEKIDFATADNNLIISSKWLWPLIITVLVILGFFTFRLTKEIEKR